MDHIVPLKKKIYLYIYHVFTHFNLQDYHICLMAFKILVRQTCLRAYISSTLENVFAVIFSLSLIYYHPSFKKGPF